MSKVFAFQIYLGLISFLLVSCNNPSKKNLQSSHQEGHQLKFTVDTLRIQMDYNTANYFNTFSAYIDDQKNYLMAYDSYNHGIVNINLDDAEVDSYVKLDLNGENGVTSIEGFYVHNLDSIFIYEPGKIKLINKNATVLRKYNVVGTFPEGFGFLYTNYLFKLRYSPELKCVFLNNIFKGNRKLEIGNPAVVKLNILSGQMELLPITYSEYIMENNGLFGYQFGLNFDYSEENKFYYTFPVQSEIFVFDLLTNQVEEYPAFSQYTPSEVKPVSNMGNRNEGRTNFVENPCFYGVMYDKAHNLYYRIHREGKPFNIMEDEFNTVADVHFYITILDKDFGYLNEIELPKNVYNQYTWFYLNGSLYLSASNNKYENLREDVLELHKFTFEVAEVK